MDVRRSLQEEASTDEIVGIVVFYVVLLLAFLSLLILLNSTVKIVRHAEVMVIERLGKYHTTLSPGLHFLIPFIDVPRQVNWRYVDVKYGTDEVVVKSINTARIDMREHVLDFGRQFVITKDTVQIHVDALVYFQIADPRLAVFNIQNLPDAVELLTQSTLRNVIAQLSLDDTFSSRERMNEELLRAIMRDAERWGVRITRVEVKEIIPPQDIKKTMEAQIIAERERRSMVLNADGERESAIIRSQGDAAKLVLQAEGQRTSLITQAKGEADAKMAIARAESSALRDLREVTSQNGVKASEYLVAIQYLSTLKDLTKGASAKVVLLPANSLSTISSIMKYTRPAPRAA